MFQQTWAMSYVAILETLGDSSLTLKEKQYVTDKIRNMALNHLPRKNYDIITRENILVMLPPDKELYECEGSCIVETGKNISADYVGEARIEKNFEQYTVVVELYETATGKLCGSLTEQRPTIESILMAIEEGSEKIFGNIKGYKSTQIPTGIEHFTNKPIMYGGITAGAISLISFGLGIYSHFQAVNKSEKKTRNMEDYNKNHNDIKDFQNRRNIFYIIGATTMLISGTLLPMIKPRIFALTMEKFTRHKVLFMKL